MSEVTFCKSFLTALDARPVKLSSDHIADARQYPAQGAYTLPRLPHLSHPARPNASTTSHGSSTAAPTTLSVSLKPMKSTFPTVPLSDIEASKTSVYDLKQRYSSSCDIDGSKIKILYKKKPVADSKTVAEVIGDAEGEVEFTVMVMGGATPSSASARTSVQSEVQSPPAVAPSEAEKGLGESGSCTKTPSGAVGPSGKEIVVTDEFWADLRSFVQQRIKDESESERLISVFKTAWETHK